ncbi:MAG: tetratricopeptide repeat protein, partial [Muribaculaceae bacterium]|nr:tetratricopeptide repeat protein [Muribaculaceae bacterium]
MSVNRLTYSFSGPAFIVGLLVITLLCGCRHSLDPALTKADSKMEEHPDSALMLLNGYSLTTQASAADSAYYALLLTHARYKNFIDETNDSLISTATEYFLNHGDDEKASRALFLKGIILMNANHLGEAAVSFRQGLDIAHEGKHYMWEGQCARGLFIIYGKIKNYSEQIKYAQAEYDAFVKGNYPNWANNAKLNILRAYQNNQQFDKVEDDAFVLLTTAEEAKDTMLMEEVLVLIGSCKYALGNYKDALDSYLKAYSLDPSIIRTTHGYNIAVAAANIEKDSLTNEMKSFISSVTSRKETLPAFKVLASQGRFEEAFNGLERYKDYQDSILQIICRNNVAESIGHYDNTRTVVHQKEIKIERILWGSGLLVLTIIIGVSYWIYKKNLYQKELERKHIEMSMEMLRTDLESQLAHMDEMTADILRINNKTEKMSCALRNLLYDRYK